jgi:hypothetical protein
VPQSWLVFRRQWITRDSRPRLLEVTLESGHLPDATETPDSGRPAADF